MSRIHRPFHATLRPAILALAVAAASTAVVATTGVASSAHQVSSTTTSACSVIWGSLTKSRPGLSTAPLTNIRSGRHACYDRLVLDLAGKARGYRVSYVDAVRSQGSGHVLPLRGGARLQVDLFAPAYDSAGRATYSFANSRELVNVTGYDTFRQVAWGGSHEGYTTVGLGVRARLPMRVFVLDGPGAGSRVVIDVAHRW